ncbi:MAG: DcrB-related protein [Planctomycetota bacterium]
MTSSWNASRIRLEVPDEWRDETVFRLATEDRAVQITIEFEAHFGEAPLEAHLEARTELASRDEVDADLVERGEISLGSLEGRFGVIRIRDEDEPSYIMVVVALPSPLELLAINVVAEATRWEDARAEIESLVKSIRLDADEDR